MNFGMPKKIKSQKEAFSELFGIEKKVIIMRKKFLESK